ncbi:hypothetical protein VKT23_000656 [Stygiomarasmius scandens]|uniref:Uncharacterized protein n=1 Tax=Marasmiellus scandens TaxID=2682957 RepID=A0ABR1K4R5_9AGAR
MGFLTYFSSSSKVALNAVEKESPQVPDPVTENTNQTGSTSDASSSEAATEGSVPTSPRDVPLSPTTTSPDSHVPTPSDPKSPRRFSFRNLAGSRSRNEHKHSLSAVEEHEKRVEATAALSKRKAKPLLMTSDRRAEESALMVRELIVGPTAVSPSVTKAVARPHVGKLKSQLMKPKSANKVIAHLRSLPAEGDLPNDGKKSGPIHAVCLAHTDEEEHSLHFSKLSKADAQKEDNVIDAMGDCSSAAVESLSALFNEMNIIDLIKSPDLGLGQPGDGGGILAGALPTAETVIKGVEQLTPQLMALGYATGRAIIPDHTGIHPPTDRMSVLTYWWGLEVCMPPPTLSYLNSAHSVSGTAVNFLSALALVNNGVREILPFIRYISQFIDFEFKNIQAQDQGNGVVCAATWIMPAAMVPRPWDFTPPVEVLVPPAQPPENFFNAPATDAKPSDGKVPEGQAPESPVKPEPQLPSKPDETPSAPSPVISPIPMTPMTVAANA